MKCSFIVFLIACALNAFAQNTSTIVFNELNCDNPGGADNAEFLELFGAPNTSLDGLVLVFFEGDIDQSYLAIDLDGYTLDNGGFFVVGSAGVPNVDYILPNTLISNGPDAIALYEGNLSDFPNGTLPNSNQLLEAAVYETSDTEDSTLIELLGLNALTENYTQLDETLQVSFPDLSLSRIPDGGDPFAFNNFVLRTVTPGTWNQLPCSADSLFASGAATFCNTEEPALFSWYTEGNNVSPTFIITDSNDVIADFTNEFSFSFANYPTGVYRIYGMNYTGVLDSLTLVSGSSINDVNASECLSISDNFIEVTIENCSACDGGNIAFTDSTDAYCNSQSEPISFLSSSNAASDNYLFVITNSEGDIYSYASESISLQNFSEGTYTVTGLSFSGELSGLTLGNSISEISATECSAFSINTLQLNVYTCSSFNSCSKLFISEYLEGSNGTKALELFNPSENVIDLSEYSISQYANGVLNATNTLQLSGALLPMNTYVISNPTQGGSAGTADPQVLQRANLIHPIANFNGNDALELWHNDTLIDVIGVVGENPGSSVGWPVGNTSTTDVDMVRRYDIQSPATNWAVSSQQWNTFSNETISNLGNHYFKRCPEETFGGFLDDAIVVSEESNAITIGVQCIYMSSPLSMSIQWESGTATSEDFVMSIPDTIDFYETHSLVYFTVTLIDDIAPEGSETIVLSLQSDSSIVWFNQQLQITIEASDANCSGGIISALNPSALSQCSDVANAPLELQVSSDFPINNYNLVITDTNQVIVAITDESMVQLDSLGEGNYHIWGLSYNGILDSAGITPGLSISHINASECASLSENFLQVTREACLTYGCESDSIMLLDGNTFMTLCSGNQPSEVPLLHTSESIDAMYSFFVTDSLGNIINANNGIWQVSNISAGYYQIFGVSHLEELLDSTVVLGLPFSAIASNGCIEISANDIDIYVYDCLEHAPCTQLIISEMIEHIQSNKALELYNPTPYPIDLSDYQLKLYANGSSVPTCTQALAGVLPAHEVVVIAAPTTGAGTIDAALFDATDVTSECAEFTGNDAIELTFQGAAIDVIGIVGEDSGGTGWLFGNSSTTNRTLVRRADITSPSTDWNLASGQWHSYASNDYSHIGSHASWNCGLNAVPIAGFETASQTIAESEGSIISIPIQLENVSNDFPLTISISGSATLDEDYTIVGSTELNISEGIQEISLEIILLGDAIWEGDETILLTLNSDEDVFFTQATHTIIIEENVGLTAIENENIRIYPNPAMHEFTVQSGESILEATLIDLQGRIIETVKPERLNKDIHWSVNSIQAGSYLLLLHMDDRLIRLPLVITH